MLLDVGCGNDSPFICKTVRPDIYYVGIDIGDYSQFRHPSNIADEYVITTPDAFANTIDDLGKKFDAIISAHNLEHCNDPDATLRAMLRALKPEGRLFLSFPSEASILFPKRQGLNFFDDCTHREIPQFSEVLKLIKSEGFQIDFVSERHRPKFLVLVGWLFEPISAFCGKILIGTWELYGFESIIWAKKSV
jgi:SAM-dependent methyltransferase